MFLLLKPDPVLSFAESLHHPYPQQQQQQQQEQQNNATPQEGNYSPLRHGGITEPSDPDEFCRNKRVRYKFMGKVFFILSAQTLFMMSIVAMFTFIDPVRLFVKEEPGWCFMMSQALFFPIYVLIMCFHEAGRQLPWNFVVLFILTLIMSLDAGVTSSCLDTMAVFFVLGIVAVECFITAIVFRVKSQVDFTFCTFVFYALGVVLLMTGFTTAVTLSIPYIQWIDLILTVYGLMFYFMFLAGSTSVLQDIASVSLRPNEYVFGALAIYIIFPLLPFNHTNTNEPQAILGLASTN